MGQRQRGLRSPPRQGQEKGKLAPGRGPEPEPRWPLEGKVAAGHLSLPSASWARGARRVVCPRSAASRGTGRRPGLSPAEGRRPEVATGSLLPSGSASCCAPARAACQEGISRSQALRTPTLPPPQKPLPGKFHEAGRPETASPLCEGASSAPTCQGLEWGAAPQPQPLLAFLGSPLLRCP